MPDRWMIALSYPEWLRLMATGSLLVTDRIRRLNGEEQDMFDRLLDLAPDTGFADQGYLLAALDDTKLPGPRFPDLPELRELPITAVIAFHPVTERGARLLTDDADRAAVRLADPIHERLWNVWVRRRAERHAELRGRRLREVFGLDEDSGISPDLAEIQAFCLGHTALPNADKVGRLSGTAAFAWAGAFGVATEGMAKGRKEAVTQVLDLSRKLTELKGQDARRTPCIAGRRFGSMTGTELLAKVVETTGRTSLGALQVLVVALHYRDLFVHDAEVDPDFLRQDLFEVFQASGRSPAALAAHSVGAGMPDEAVSALWGASPAVALRVHAGVLHDRRVPEVTASGPDPGFKAGGGTKKDPPVTAAIEMGLEHLPRDPSITETAGAKSLRLPLSHADGPSEGSEDQSALQQVAVDTLEPPGVEPNAPSVSPQDEKTSLSSPRDLDDVGIAEVLVAPTASGEDALSAGKLAGTNPPTGASASDSLDSDGDIDYRSMEDGSYQNGGNQPPVS
jgi:hypothetical protein